MQLTIDDILLKLNLAKENDKNFHLGDMLLDLCEAIQNEFNIRDKKEISCHSSKEKQPKPAKDSQQTSAGKSKRAKVKSKQ